MKKITTLFILLFVTMSMSNQLKAQSSCVWAKKASGSLEDAATSVANDAYGNVYTLGVFFSQTMVAGTTTLHNAAYANDESNVFLIKTDVCGNIKWVKQAGGSDQTRAKGVAVDPSGNVFVVGYYRADTLHFGTSAIKLVNATGTTEAYVAKYDSTGAVIWAKQGTGDAYDEMYAVATDASGNVYIAGAYSSDVLTIGTSTVTNYDNNNYDDVFVTKLDNNGNVQWLKAGKGDYQDEAYGIATDAVGNVYVSGTFGSSSITFGSLSDVLSTDGYYDIFVVKYNTNGTEQWIQTAGGNSDDNEALSIAADANGNTYVTGYIGSSGSSNAPVSFGSYNLTNPSYWPTLFVAKYDNGGNVQWANVGGSDAYTRGNWGNTIKVDVAGNPFVIGQFSSDSLNLGTTAVYNNSLLIGGGDTIQDVFVAKYKTNGTVAWARSVGGAGNDMGMGIAPGANGSLFICGEYQSTSIDFAGITLTAVNNIGDAFIANNISAVGVIPEICMVTTDSTSTNNIVYWDKTSYADADSFIVYREVTTGNYKRIGAQPYAALSQFIDTARHIGPANGDPNLTTYAYKLQVLDTGGNYSQLSLFHHTVNILPPSSGGTTFTWNLYTVENASVTPVSQFNLLRDNLSNGNWQVIASSAGTASSLNDPSYATYTLTASWRVEGLGFNCNPTEKLAGGTNSTQAAKVKSKSNIANNRMAGIKQIANASFVGIYPNPNQGNFVVETTNTEKQTLQVFDMNGKLVLSQIITGSTTIDASALSDGIYNVSLQNNNSIANKKLVIVR